jgi:hypothetical protein
MARDDFATFRKKVPAHTLFNYDILAGQFRQLAKQYGNKKTSATRRRRSLMKPEIIYRNVRQKGKM